MIQKQFQITSPNGLGSRASAALVREANQFHCDSFINYQHESANLKSIMNVMALVIRQGETFSLTFDGEDETQAMDTLIEVMQSQQLIS